MKGIRRAWQPKPKSSSSAVVRGHLRGALSQPLRALKTSTTGAPLSLNDIIAFESELPRLLVQEAPVPERRVDELIDRASRVLREANSVLEVEAEGGEGQQQSGASTATLTTAPPAPPGQGAPQAAAAAGVPSEVGSAAASGSTTPLGRAVFGGSAQVSEREASITRQALQKTLEAAPPAGRSDAPPGFAVAGASEAGAAAGEAQERPAWAQALFSSAPSTAAAAPTAPAAKSSRPTSSPSLPPSSSAAASPPSAPGTLGSRPTGQSSSSSPGSSSSSSNPQQQGQSAPAAFNGGGAARTAPAASSSSAPPLPVQMQVAAPSRRPLAAWTPLAFAEVDLSVPTELLLKSEDSLFAEAARAAVLPPLQSVVDLTAAVRPPSRGLDLDLGSATDEQQEAVSAAVAVSEEAVVQLGALGRRLQDGAGRLADGTRFEKLSGTDTGPDGYVKNWEVLRGVTGDGTVQWEECWWQASNRYGLRELGAFKKGTSETGAAWVEEWKEVLSTHPTNLRLVIERTAHKWARDESADEWEEKWAECFEEAGRVHKWADKWAKAGSNVWHERWGEDYDGRGACQKWTDKWAERLLPDGGQEQWGDKWTETFGDGKGTKHGEVWSSSGGGRYNRWWNEEHFGGNRVRKWGNSTSGEYWDTEENMDCYYNPVPHFGFHHAVGHSPQLWSVPLPAPEEGDGDISDDDGLGVGLGRL